MRICDKIHQLLHMYSIYVYITNLPYLFGLFAIQQTLLSQRPWSMLQPKFPRLYAASMYVRVSSCNLRRPNFLRLPTNQHVYHLLGTWSTKFMDEKCYFEFVKYAHWKKKKSV